MKKLFVVGNWKSNKTVKEAEEWIKEFTGTWNMEYGTQENLEIILCPPFTLLYYLKLQVTSYKLQVKLGAQDISPFPDGAYTGEISARMLKDLGVEYVIIGHSERRKYFKEDMQMLENKVREAFDAGLSPIFCVQEKTTPVPEGVKIVAYEPVFAIGTGTPDTPENANEIAKIIKERLGGNTVVLYGGSVIPENVKRFYQQENINGILVGGASLDPEKFLKIIEHASKI
jgi:triosephosphate isomerase